MVWGCAVEVDVDVTPGSRWLARSEHIAIKLAANLTVCRQIRPAYFGQYAPMLAPTKRVAAILRAAEPSRYYPALALIVATGLRKGEALALRWDNDVLNLDEGWLKVRQTVSRIDGKLVFSEPKDRPVPSDRTALPSCRGDAAPAPESSGRREAARI